MIFFFFFISTAPTAIYTSCHTLSLHDALPIFLRQDLVENLHFMIVDGLHVPASHDCLVRFFSTLVARRFRARGAIGGCRRRRRRFSSLANLGQARSEEHTSELQSLMRISYAVFCLKKKTKQ